MLLYLVESITYLPMIIILSSSKKKKMWKRGIKVFFPLANSHDLSTPRGCHVLKDLITV